jgi:hypothetical protein
MALIVCDRHERKFKKDQYNQAELGRLSRKIVPNNSRPPDAFAHSLQRDRSQLLIYRKDYRAF